MTSILCTHGSGLVDLDDLRLLPEPQALGTRHKPIHPARLVETVIEQIQSFDKEISNISLSLNGKKNKLAATIDIKPWTDNAEHSYSVGFVTSTNRATSLRFVGGRRIFVCANLCVNGDVIMFRKHTKGLSLESEVHNKISAALDACKSIDQIEATQAAVSMDERRVYELAGRALTEGLLPAERVRDAAKWWVDGEYPDVESRTLWGVNNAFTRAVNLLVPSRRIHAATDVANFMKTYQR